MAYANLMTYWLNKLLTSVCLSKCRNTRAGAVSANTPCIMGISFFAANATFRFIILGGENAPQIRIGKTSGTFRLTFFRSLARQTRLKIQHFMIRFL